MYILNCTMNITQCTYYTFDSRIYMVNRRLGMKDCAVVI